MTILFGEGLSSGNRDEYSNADPTPPKCGTPAEAIVSERSEPKSTCLGFLLTTACSVSTACHLFLNDLYSEDLQQWLDTLTEL